MNTSRISGIQFYFHAFVQFVVTILATPFIAIVLILAFGFLVLVTIATFFYGGTDRGVRVAIGSVYFLYGAFILMPYYALIDHNRHTEQIPL